MCARFASRATTATARATSLDDVGVDTDVLIWHLRGYPQATRRLDELGALTLSAISWLEVLQGMRNKAELLAVKKMLDKRSARLLPVTEATPDDEAALVVGGAVFLQPGGDVVDDLRGVH